MAFQQAYDSREKPVTKALLHPPTIARMHESLSTSPGSPIGMDKEGSRLGTWVVDIFPDAERSYRTGASGAQTGRVGICNNIRNWDMSWTRTTIRKGYYRPQQEAVVQVASEGKDFGHPLFCL